MQLGLRPETEDLLEQVKDMIENEIMPWKKNTTPRSKRRPLGLYRAAGRDP